MTSTLEVHTVDVSDKTTWIWFRLIGDDRAEGVGEATLNNRTDDVLSTIQDAVEALNACPYGQGAKLAAIRAAVPDVVGRAIASGLEQAWLDREGRRLGCPVHHLLGGRYRDAVPCYANINRGTLSRTPDEFADRAALAVDEGYAAVKLAPFDGVTPDDSNLSQRSALIETGIERIAAVIERVGDRARVQVDCHSRFRAEETAGMLNRLADLGVAWFEEPVLETADALPALAGLRRLAGERGVTLAGAEKAADLAAFLPFCAGGCYDVIMPDIVLAGGPCEVVRIGHLANAHGMGVSLHNPCGPVMDMHSAHAALALPVLHSLERQFRETSLYDELTSREHTWSAGGFRLDNTPGLGLAVNWQSDAIRKALSLDLEI